MKKMNKSYILLRMYDRFCHGEGVNLNECCNGCGISVATFRRYIAFLREYFYDMYEAKIVYDGNAARYRLSYEN